MNNNNLEHDLTASFVGGHKNLRDADMGDALIACSCDFGHVDTPSPDTHKVACVRTTTLLGIEAMPVEIEAHIAPGLKRFAVVGLPDGVLKESKDRIRCAINNSGFDFPDQEVVVSLTPAELPKIGAGLELGVALAILAADGQIPKQAFEGRIVIGELSLDGGVKSVKGAFASVCYARDCNMRELIMPAKDAPISSIVKGVRVIGVFSLCETVAYLKGQRDLTPIFTTDIDTISNSNAFFGNACYGDTSLGFDEVVGQHTAKRALEIAAAGAHNVLMSGPPGAGKSMLASRLSSILPALSSDEVIEVTKIHSLNVFSHSYDFNNTQLDEASCNSLWMLKRPFRAPHHTISSAGLIGGGSVAKPGEISLAHKGVLFLDELTEFKRDVLECLRQPLESKTVRVSRARFSICFPADFMLVAAMNPCPCGLYGDGTGRCKCTPADLRRYRARLSSPLLDRIDLHIWVPAVNSLDILQKERFKTQQNAHENDILTRVVNARKIQHTRFNSHTKTNTSMTSKELIEYCQLSSAALKLLSDACQRYKLSARAYTRVLKVARTIADIDGVKDIDVSHVAEAVSYREINTR